MIKRPIVMNSKCNVNCDNKEYKSAIEFYSKAIDKTSIEQFATECKINKVRAAPNGLFSKLSKPAIEYQQCQWNSFSPHRREQRQLLLQDDLEIVMIVVA